MNTKGQIDQIITGVIVLFVVFFLMVAFVIISSNIAVLYGPDFSVEEQSSKLSQDALLLKQVNASNKEMLFVEAVVRFVRDEVTRRDLEKVIDNMVSNENNCALLSIHKEGEGADVRIGRYLPIEGKDLIDPVTVAGPYEDLSKFTKVPLIINQDKYVITTYYGQCLEGKDV